MGCLCCIFPIALHFSQIQKGERIYIKAIHSSLFRRYDFLRRRFILHMGTLIWVDMINTGTKLPDIVKLKGIRQSPLPPCVLEIVITVDHLASTSTGYYMNQLPAIDLRSVCPPVVSNINLNKRLDYMEVAQSPVKSPMFCFDIKVIIAMYHFLFTRLRWQSSSRLKSWQVLSRFLSIPLYCMGLWFLCLFRKLLLAHASLTCCYCLTMMCHMASDLFTWTSGHLTGACKSFAIVLGTFCHFLKAVLL